MCFNKSRRSIPYVFIVTYFLNRPYKNILINNFFKYIPFIRRFTSILKWNEKGVKLPLFCYFVVNLLEMHERDVHWCWLREIWSFAQSMPTECKVKHNMKWCSYSFILICVITWWVCSHCVNFGYYTSDIYIYVYACVCFPRLVTHRAANSFLFVFESINGFYSGWYILLVSGC